MLELLVAPLEAVSDPAWVVSRSERQTGKTPRRRSQERARLQHLRREAIRLQSRPELLAAHYRPSVAGSLRQAPVRLDLGRRRNRGSPGIDVTADISELRRRVTEARVARLATTDATGRPHLVPICFALDGETLYSAVDQKPKTSIRLRRLDNILARPDVAVLVDHYEEDWSRLWWVRLRGRARVIEAGPERVQAVSLLGEKYAQYRESPPMGAVIAMKIEEWRGWTASETMTP